ncbi:MAG: hypothetical protein JWM57_2825 [Phycisphaerales bacterium]|nr:hypothetical protein [Phycisphaerales bacterium]
MLERAILFTFVIHVVAMLGMVACLLPGIPGGSAATVADRATYVATHPWLWRTGWLGWQLTAASDLYLSIALVCTPWIPRRPAWFALIVTLIALLPDQIGQFLWSVNGPHYAAEALAANTPAADALARSELAGYGVLEGQLFKAVGGWGAGLYLIAAIGWTRCFYQAGTWSKPLKWLSIGAWSVFAVAVTVLFLPVSGWTPFLMTAAGGLNALAFVLLLGWIATAGELVMRRSRPTTPHGRHAQWTYPRSGVYGIVANYLANSRFVRGLFEYVPPLSMASDIRDVIYVNYLVEADTLAALVPPPLKLQRLGDNGRWAMFTFLIYRHGHFGPRLFGPLRRLWPSPIQSNWRLYVTDPLTGLDGVYFLTTAITAVPYSLAARYLSEGVAMHVPLRADMQTTPDGHWTTTLSPGQGLGLGTAPDARLSLHPAPTATDTATPMPAPWPQVFPTAQAALAYCVPQDRAFNVQPWHGRVTRQEIQLNIPLQSCELLTGTVESTAAKAIVGDAPPFCFCVPRVVFRYGGEIWRSEGL